MASCCSRNTELLIYILQILFVAINIIVMLLGLGSIIVCSLALSNMSKIDTDHIKPLMDTITVDAIQPLGVVQNIFYISIFVGVVTIILILLAGALSCCKSDIRKYALLTYTIFILSLISLEIAVTIQLSNTKDTVDDEIKSKMILALNHFKADATTNSNSISNAWNFLFMTLNCCGVNAVVSTTNDFDATTWCTTSGSCQATSSQIPKTCCLNVDENTYSSAPSGCHASVNSGTYNTQGCYDALKEILLKYFSSAIGLVYTTVILEIVAVVIGYMLFRMLVYGVHPS